MIARTRRIKLIKLKVFNSFLVFLNKLEIKPISIQPIPNLPFVNYGSKITKIDEVRGAGEDRNEPYVEYGE